MDLCKYKYILGVPGEGIHSWKFNGTSLVDYFMTIIGAFIITYYTKIPLVITTVVLFLLGILFHYMFCLPTQTIMFFKR